MRASVLDIWTNWHAAYHGTRADAVLDILSTGELLKTGNIGYIGLIKTHTSFSSPSIILHKPQHTEGQRTVLVQVDACRCPDD